jgi:membrane protease YdiL (CAAX protease family)
MKNVAMKTLAVRGRPVSAYFILAFALTWGGILFMTGPSGIPGSGEELRFLFLPVFLAMCSGPVFAAIVVAIASEPRGFGGVISGMAKWRVGTDLYAIALLTGPLCAAAAGALLVPFSDDYLPRILAPGDLSELLLLGVVGGLAAGFLEEIGWTGIATRRLLAKLDIVAVAITVGTVHALWHFLAGYWGAGMKYGPLFLPHFLVFWVAGLFGLRLLIVWLYARSQSLLLAQLTHASYSGSLFLLMPASTDPAQDIVFAAAFVGILLNVVATIVFVGRKQRT